MIMFAYDIRQFQVVGGPGWINTERYDVKARPPANRELPKGEASTPEQREAFPKFVRPRMQNLLTELFQLKL